MLLLIPCIISGFWFFQKIKESQRNVWERYLWALYGFALFFILYVISACVLAEIFDAKTTALSIIFVALILSSLLIFFIGRFVRKILPRQISLESMRAEPNNVLILNMIFRTVAGIILVGVFFYIGGNIGDEYDIQYKRCDDFDAGAAFFITIAGVLFYYLTCDYLIALMRVKRLFGLAVALLILVGGLYIYVLCFFWFNVLRTIE